MKFHQAMYCSHFNLLSIVKHNMLICTRIPAQVVEQTPGGPGRPGSPCGGRHVCSPGSLVSPCDSDVWDDDVQSMMFTFIAHQKNKKGRKKKEKGKRKNHK